MTAWLNVGFSDASFLGSLNCELFRHRGGRRFTKTCSPPRILGDYNPFTYCTQICIRPDSRRRNLVCAEPPLNTDSPDKSVLGRTSKGCNMALFQSLTGTTTSKEILADKAARSVLANLNRAPLLSGILGSARKP
ncbi:hypothetical protein J6590_043162 [Homalodisca vitripennis]|nr:hypothetical protein J6590_043162 [Homalodisca vitripennis]